MGSRNKHEKAPSAVPPTNAAANSSVWSSKHSAYHGTTPLAFHDFEESVSDAWDVCCDHIDVGGSQSPESAGLGVIDVQPGGGGRSRSKKQQKPLDSSLLPPPPKTPDDAKKKKNLTKLEVLLEKPTFELEDLRRLAWSGIPCRARSTAWKTLCGYLPLDHRHQAEVVQRKRDEYARYVKQYFATKDDTYRQIHIDIPRMSPVVGLFQQRCVQEIFERILYIWAIRHPASGYVQGINDLVTPFFLVFLHDFLFRKNNADEDSELPFSAVLGDDLNVEQSLEDDERNVVEADSFWCLTKILDGIQDNYTFAQPGIQLKIKQLEELIRRYDAELHNHLVRHDVTYLQFAFRWMNNLLMRELPIRATVRLWDTYLAQADGFSHFHLYVCAAFLMRWKSELLKKSDFHTLLMFLQNLPTAKWGDGDVNLLVAEAYQLSYLFAGAPSHLSHNDSAANNSSSSTTAAC